MIKALFHKYFELIFWITALIALGLSNPAGPVHYTLCPFRLMGFKWCPGCGIGHSIAWLLHGDIKNSLHAHWLGVPALLMIMYRIGVLARDKALTQPFSKKKAFKKSNLESSPL